MFVDMVSKFIVSLCQNNSNAYFYALNQKSNNIIQNQITLTAPFFKAHYTNGVLQIVTQTSQKGVYYQIYFVWIKNNIINVENILNSSQLFTNCWIEFVILQISSNYSSQPCQIFGISAESFAVNFLNPSFYLVKICTNSQKSQIFGFPGNNYTFNEILFEVTIVWRLLQSLQASYHLQLDVVQIGSTQQIKDDVIEAQFLVPIVYHAYRYLILFNSTDGTILSFKQANNYYITVSRQGYENYEMFQTNNGPLLNVEGFYNSSIVNLYFYPTMKNVLNNYDFIQIIGSIQFNDFSASTPLQNVGNYFLFIEQSKKKTIIYQVQDHISINIDMTWFETSDITITAINDLGSSVQNLTINNIYYQQADETEEQNEEAATEEQSQEGTEEQSGDGNEESNNNDEKSSNNNDEEQSNNNDEESSNNNNGEESDNNSNSKKSNKKLFIILSSVVTFIICFLLSLGFWCLNKKRAMEQNQYVKMQQGQVQE